MNKQLHFLGLVLAFVACNRDHDAVVPTPRVTVSSTVESLEVGGTVVLHPTVDQRAGLTYQWRVNGTPSGTDSVFTFEAKERGTFHIVFQATNASGTDSAVYNLKVLGKYENGFYILNEGWMGTETGSVHYYQYGADTVTTWVYTKENPDKVFGTKTTTLQYGVMYNNKLYMVLKAGGPLLVADPVTLKETARVEKVAAGKGTTFVGIDNTRGLIAASDGVYPINLNTLALGAKLTGITGYTGNMVKGGDYVFVHNQTDGLIVLDAATYGVISKPYKATIGFVQAKDGLVYGAKDSMLISISPQTLVMDTVKMPFRVVSPFGAWRSVNMSVSTKENILYIVRPGASAFSYGNRLYRYVIGDASSLSQPFITLPDGQFFYGSGVTYDPHNNELILTTINGSLTGDVNRVLIYDAATATLKKTITYNGWYFPAMVVLQP